MFCFALVNVISLNQLSVFIQTYMNENFQALTTVIFCVFYSFLNKKLSPNWNQCHVQCIMLSNIHIIVWAIISLRNKTLAIDTLFILIFIIICLFLIYFPNEVSAFKQMFPILPTIMHISSIYFLYLNSNLNLLEISTSFNIILTGMSFMLLTVFEMISDFLRQGLARKIYKINRRTNIILAAARKIDVTGQMSSILFKYTVEMNDILSQKKLCNVHCTV